MMEDMTYDTIEKLVKVLKKQDEADRKLDTVKNKEAEKQLKSIYNMLSRSLVMRDRTDIEIADREGKRLKRRFAATLNMVDDVRNRLGGKYPGSFVTKNLFFLSSANSMSYDSINQRNELTLAAALWILDELKTCDRLEEAYQYFPKEYISRKEINLRGDIKDAEHGSVVINNMVSVIQTRNKDFNVERNAMPRYILDDINTSYKEYGESFYRKRYDDIIALIPEESIEKAVADFRDRFFERLDIVCALDSYYAAQRSEIAGKLENEVFIKRKKPVEGTARVVPFLKNLKSVAEIAGNPFADDYACGLLDQLKECMDKDSDVLQWFCDTSIIDNEDLEKLPPEIADRVRKWEAVDPFATAFVLFYLADKKDDMIWNYGISFSIVYAATKHMPWILGSISHNAYVINGMRADEEYAELAAIDSKYHFDKFFGFTDISGTDTDEDGNDVEGKFSSRLPLSVFIFSHTGLIMPRRMHTWPGFYKEMQDFGLSDMESGYLNAIVNVINTMKDSSQMIYDMDDEELDDDEFEDDFGYDSSGDEEDIIEELQKSREEIQRLKKELHGISRQKEKLAAENDKLVASVDSMTDELANLREVVYNAGQEFIPELEELETVFPYNTSKRIVVFGGHDSWTREIRQRLPDVKFVHRDVTPTAELVRAADIVFVQTNCLNHPAYWKIVELCKSYKVKLRYFTKASAEISAKEIVREDRN